MLIFLIILGVLLLYYLAYIYIFYRGLDRKYLAANTAMLKVSVVVAAYNEENTIGQLLTCLINQDYPQDMYELIIVDDDSSDRTREIIKEFQEKAPNLKLLHANQVRNIRSRKKNALSLGVKESKGEIILTTDADCIVGYQWISGMTRYFGRGVGMVAGFSEPLIPNWRKASFVQKYEYIDTIALFFAAAGAIGSNKSFSCSGQNLGFTREAFDRINGYERIKNYISGDDVLLMQLLQRAGYKIRFAFGQETYAATRSERNLGSFLNQRTRWASNEKPQAFLNREFFFYLIDVFLLNIFVLAGMFFFPLYVGIAWFVKAVSEYIILKRGMSRFKIQTQRMSLFPIWAILQPLYITIVGIGGKLNLFSWKKRTYSTD
ncbi:MAG TPA: glycosyltransferase [Candidatus Cloacimonetes bacterium]|nr:glycosyltransferase [Candidatus Cloacimonadota bacterium]